MSGLVLRPAAREDAAYLAPRLRPWDVKEVRGIVGPDMPMAEALDTSIANSHWAYVALDAGEPVWIAGVGRTPQGFGSPWLLGTEKYSRKKKSFLLHTRRLVQRMASEHSVLTNLVAADNELTKPWLMWLGFEIRPERIYVRKGGIPFNIFVRFS